MNKLYRVFEKISVVLAGIGVASIFAMMFLISADVAIRWVSNGSIKGTYELVEILMAISVFSVFSYTQVKKGHVHVTLLIQHYPQKGKMISYAVTSLATTVVMFAISYAALTQGRQVISTGQVTSVLKIPMYPFYFYEAFAMLFFALVLLLDTVNCFIAIFNKAKAEEITSSWS